MRGGDVIVDGEHLFVGYGQRSDEAGFEFLKEHFSDRFNVVPLPTKWNTEEADVLHLDCTFNPLGLGHALMFPDGLVKVPDVMRTKFDWIEVTREEAGNMATNVLSIAPDTVIARSGEPCARVNTELRQAGYKVIEVTFDGGAEHGRLVPLCDLAFAAKRGGIVTAEKIGFGIIRARDDRRVPCPRDCCNGGGGTRCLFLAAIQAKADAFADMHGARGYSKFDEFLADDRLDVVTICTPSGAHLEPVLASAKAGKHVICEKTSERSRPGGWIR